MMERASVVAAVALVAFLWSLSRYVRTMHRCTDAPMHRCTERELRKLAERVAAVEAQVSTMFAMLYRGNGEDPDPVPVLTRAEGDACGR